MNDNDRQPYVISYGLDYVRFKVNSPQDIYFVAEKMGYLDVYPVWHHGSQFMDITGSMLEVVRLFDSVDDIVLSCAQVLECHRLDVFVDVLDDWLPDVAQSGTVIMNNGKIETIYSTHLKRRGDVTRFVRVYDACAAGHYECATTRFECEFKREAARGILTPDGWKVNPIGAALHVFKALTGISIWIEDIDSIELDTPRRRYEHSRERFYARYGKSILQDMESMGLQQLHKFVLECVRGDNEKGTKRGEDTQSGKQSVDNVV